MNMGLAPRPENEELRAQTVMKTGLIDAPNPDLFQIYCDLAKDITGFETASFSLYDGEMKCSIASAGDDEFVAWHEIRAPRIQRLQLCFVGY